MIKPQQETTQAPENRTEQTLQVERGFMQRLRESQLNLLQRESGLALAALFIMLTVACSKMEPTDLPPDQDDVVDIEPDEPGIEPIPIPEELAQRMERYQGIITKMHKYGNPVQFNGVTFVIDLKGQLSSSDMMALTGVIGDIGSAMVFDDFHVQRNYEDPLDWYYSRTDRHPKDDETIVMPAYQIAVMNSADGFVLELRNWVAGEIVAQVPLDLDLNKLDYEPDLDFSLNKTSEEVDIPRDQSLQRVITQMEERVKRELAPMIDVLNPAEGESLSPQELIEQSSSAKLSAPYANYVQTLETITDKGHQVEFVGFSTAVEFTDEMSKSDIFDLATEIDNILSVSGRELDGFFNSKEYKGLTPNEVAQNALTGVKRDPFNPNQSEVVRVPRYHVAVETDRFNAVITVEDWSTGQVVYTQEVPTYIGKIDYKALETEPIEAAKLIDSATEARKIEEQANQTNEPEVQLGKTWSQAHEESQARVNSFVSDFVALLRQDKTHIREHFERLLKREGVRADTPIELIQIVEGDGIEQLRDLLMDQNYRLSYTMLPTSEMEAKEADTEWESEYGFTFSEYGPGTLLIEGQITKLEFSKTYHDFNIGFDAIQPTVSIARDRFGNTIFHEIAYVEEGNYYEETLSVLVRMPLEEDNEITQASINIDLSDFGLGVYPDLLRHQPDHPEQVIHSEGQYNVFSRSEGLDLAKYQENLELIAAGVAQAEQEFGFVPGTLVRNIIIIDTDNINAHYAYDKPTTIVIHDEYLKKCSPAEQQNVGRHEAVHLIDNKFDLSEDTDLQAVYDGLSESFLRAMNEKAWFDSIERGGHAQDDVGELIASSTGVILDPNLHDGIDDLTSYHRSQFITMCEALAEAYDEAYERYLDSGLDDMKGFETMTISSRFRTAA